MTTQTAHSRTQAPRRRHALRCVREARVDERRQDRWRRLCRALTRRPDSSTVELDHDVDMDELTGAVIESGFTPGDPFVIDGEETSPRSKTPLQARTDAEHMDHDMDSGHMAAEEAEIARLEAVPDPDPVPTGDELSDASFAVGGMTCASCVAVIEKTLAKTPGVTSSVGEPGDRETRRDVRPGHHHRRQDRRDRRAAGLYGHAARGSPAPLQRRPARSRSCSRA